MITEPTAACPKCSSTQLTVAGKGFGGGTALLGAALLGPAGLLAGFLGSGDVRIICLVCGSRSRPAELKILQPPPTPPPPRELTEAEVHYEVELERRLERDAQRHVAEAAAHKAEIASIIAEGGFSQADISYYGSEALARPVLEERRRKAEEKRIAENIEAEEARVAKRRQLAIASGFEPDGVRLVAPIRTGPEVQPGLLKWPLWKKRP